jgi:eukaryotic-like serine/threonine-protein kinase
MSPERPIPLSGSPLKPIGGNGPKSKPAIPDHDLIRCIGEGAYGEVWLARNVLGTYRAIKIVYRKSFREERTYEREFRGIQQFEPISRTNDGLLDVLQAGRNDDAGYYYYVMELADGEEMQNEK